MTIPQKLKDALNTMTLLKAIKFAWQTKEKMNWTPEQYAAVLEYIKQSNSRYSQIKTPQPQQKQGTMIL